MNEGKANTAYHAVFGGVICCEVSFVRVFSAGEYKSCYAKAENRNSSHGLASVATY